MQLAERRKIGAKIAFFIGLLLMFAGSGLLLGTIEGTSRISVLTSFLFFLIGVIFAILAIKMNRRSIYLFFATFFLLIGFFLFFTALRIITIPFSRLWPLISVFAGLALIPAGFHHRRAFRASYMVSAFSFIILGIVLMVFSFNLVPFSFTRFVLDWWPLLVVLGGLVLVLLALSSNSKTQRPEQ